MPRPLKAITIGPTFANPIACRPRYTSIYIGFSTAYFFSRGARSFSVGSSDCIYRFFLQVRIRVGSFAALLIIRIIQFSELHHHANHRVCNFLLHATLLEVIVRTIQMPIFCLEAVIYDNSVAFVLQGSTCVFITNSNRPYFLISIISLTDTPFPHKAKFTSTQYM